MTPLRAGILAAVVTLVADQASKLWLLNVFDLARRGVVKVTPFFDLVLAWNIGISFGWLQNDGQSAQIALMAVKVVAVVALAIWMARSHTLLATVALGLSWVFLPVFPLDVALTGAACMRLLAVALVIGIAASAASVRQAVRVDPAMAFASA